MNRLLIIFSFLFFLTFINSPVLAEVNIDLLKQKYAKCEDVNYRHECFDTFIYSKAKKVGYFRNNSLWDGLYYIDNILLFEYIKGKEIGKSFCKKTNDGWINCPSGNRYKPIETGYFDKKNKRQGKFRYEYKNGDLFVGEYKDGHRHGQGTYTYSKGDKYVGEYKNNNQHGQGSYTYSNGDKYVGKYKNNVRNGQGKYTYADGTITEGIFKDGKFMYENKPTPTSNSKIEGYKTFCSEIGFTPGTEKFGECVVEAMKKG